MIKKMQSRVLSLLLVLMLTAGIFSGGALAAKQTEESVATVENDAAPLSSTDPVEESAVVAKIEDETFTSLADAIAVAEDGETVQLVQDAVVTEKITMNQSVTIEGNGKTVTGVSDNRDVYFEIIGGTIIVKNASFVGFGDQAETLSGVAVFKVPESASGTVLNAENLSISKFCRSAFDIRSGSFEIKNSTIDCASASEANKSLTKGILAGLGTNAVTGTIENTKICNSKSTYEDWSSAGIEIYNNATVSIIGGAVTGSQTGITVDNYWAGKSPFEGVSEEADVTVTIKGTSVSASSNAVVIKSRSDQTRSASVEIDGGSYTGKVAIQNESGNETITILGGSFSEDPTTYVSHGLQIAGTGPYLVTEKPEVQEPVTGDDQTTTTVTTEVKPTVADDTAKSHVTSTVMDEAVEKVLEAAEDEGTVPLLEVAVQVPEGIEALEVTMPVSSLETLGQHGQAVLTVSSDAGTVSLDSAAITALAEKAEGENVTLTVAPVAVENLNPQQQAIMDESPVYDLTLLSNSGAISSFGEGVATVTLPYMLQQDQEQDSVTVWYMDDDGKLTPCETTYQPDDQTVTFTTDHFSKYVLGYSGILTWENPFTDISEDAWYFEAVRYMSYNGYMDGTDGDVFSPISATSRAMFVTMLYRLDGRQTVSSAQRFDDVEQGQWYSDAVQWAVDNGIVQGVTSNTFAPLKNITREQMVTMLYRYAQFKHHDTSASDDLSGFADQKQVSEYAKEAMQWACGEGLMNGTSSTTLKPLGTSQRAQVAALLMRFLES